MSFRFSVILYAFNSENHISQSLDSVINQSLNFKKHIQIIAVDDASTDDTRKIIKTYQNSCSENIVLITNRSHKGLVESRNIALTHVRADFITFLDAGDNFSKNTFKAVFKFLKKSNSDILSVPIHYFSDINHPHPLNFKYENSKTTNLLKNPQDVQLSLNSSFLKFKNYNFEEDFLFVNKLLLKNPQIAYLENGRYNQRKLSDVIDFDEGVFDSFNELINCSIKQCGKVPEFIQNALAWKMAVIFETEHVDFKVDFSKIIEILSFIGKDIITNLKTGNDLLKAHMLLLKKFKYDYLNRNFDITEILDKFTLNKLQINIIEAKSKNQIYLLGVYNTLNPDENSLEIVLNDKDTVPVKYLHFPQEDTYSLNFKYVNSIYFEALIPLSDKISFKSNLQNLTIEYGKTSRLSKTAGYMKSRDYLLVDRDTHIEVIKKSFSTLLKEEASVLKVMLKKRNQGWRSGVVLRIAYIFLHPIFIKRRIWIFMDLPDRADDNSFKLFKYVSKQNLNIKTVFVCAKSSHDFKKAKKEGPTIAYGSFKHKIYALFAELIIASHPNNYIIYPFWGNFDFLAGFTRSKTVFTQHGITVHDASFWLNKFDKNLEMILTAAKSEAEWFLAFDYGYPKDAIKLTGFPRYDYLEKLEERKEIVVMPTWRRKYDTLGREEFCKLDFYKNYNRLLNDDDLIDYLKSLGYKLVFRPHNNLLKFIDLFDLHPKVEFSDKSYGDIFNHSSLLITDFSSVMFDFAYLKKPVIYYQFDGENYHFDLKKSHFTYHKMGFGPVAEKYDDLIRLIERTLEGGCEMDDVYKKRVDEFFEFQDKDNCRRVLDELLKIDDYY